MHDVLIVLGYSTDSDDPVFQSRVKKAVELFNDGIAPQIIMSGCCSDKLDIRPKTSEAAAMSDYAASLGVSGSVIMLEEESVDTLGNFYYTKTRILEPCAWYNIGVVSTPWHCYRSAWLAEQVLGPDYEITIYESDHPKTWTQAHIDQSESHNKTLREATMRQLKDITPGDHEAIASYLGTPPRGQ